MAKAAQAKFADAMRGTIDDIVDLERCPIDRPGSAARQAIVGQSRAALAADRWCTLTGFVPPEELASTAVEANPARSAKVPIA